MSEIEIKAITEDQYETWDEIVKRSPHATIIHKYDWLKIIENHTQSKLFLFAGYLGNQIIAAIPFFWKKHFFREEFSSPVGSAMIQYLGPIIPDYNTMRQNKREYYFLGFQKKLDRYMTNHFNPSLILINTPPNLLDARPYTWNNYVVHPKYTYIKNIENLNEVWAGFKYRLRKNIEGAQKAGITIEEGNLDDLKYIHQLVLQRYCEQGLDFSISIEYLMDVYRRFFPENLKIFIAKDQGNPITGVIVLAFKDKISFWAGSVQTSNKGIYPVDLLLWKVIEWGNKNGYKLCENFGANTPSISQYKSKYNFDLEIYFEVKKTQGLYKILEGIQSVTKRG